MLSYPEHPVTCDCGRMIETVYEVHGSCENCYVDRMRWCDHPTPQVVRDRERLGIKQRHGNAGNKAWQHRKNQPAE